MEVAQGHQVLERIAGVVMAMFANFIEFFRCRRGDGLHRRLYVENAALHVNLPVFLRLYDDDAAEHHRGDDEKRHQPPRRAKKLRAAG